MKTRRGASILYKDSSSYDGEKIVELLLRSLDVQPVSNTVIFNLVEVYLFMGEWDAASNTMQRAVDAFQDPSDAVRVLQQCLFDTAEFIQSNKGLSDHITTCDGAGMQASCKKLVKEDGKGVLQENMLAAFAIRLNQDHYSRMVGDQELNACVVGELKQVFKEIIAAMETDLRGPLAMASGSTSISH